MKMSRHDHIRIYFNFVLFLILYEKSFEIIFLPRLIKNAFAVNSTSYYMI